MSSLAYHESNVGDPREADRLARSAYAGSKRAASATTRALLAERVAWAAARSGEASGAERALGTVEAEYEDRRPDDEPSWVYWLDEDQIEIMAGRVWTQLCRPLRAVPILERATAGYGEETGRETALYLTWLAESLLQANVGGPGGPGGGGGRRWLGAPDRCARRSVSSWCGGSSDPFAAARLSTCSTTKRAHDEGRRRPSLRRPPACHARDGPRPGISSRARVDTRCA